MTSPAGPASPSPRQLRLWPGVVLAVTIVLLRFGLPEVVPDATPVGLLGGVGGGLLVLLWWLVFSRAAWIERLGAIAVTVVAFAATWRLLDPSIIGGAMGLLF